MPRNEDIAHIDTQIQALLDARNALATGFQEYHTKIATQIEKVLRDADVWDIVQALEAGREKRRMEDQAQANALSTKLDDLAKVKTFLQGRDAAEATEPVVEAESAPPPVKKTGRKA